MNRQHKLAVTALLVVATLVIWSCYFKGYVERYVLKSKPEPLRISLLAPRSGGLARSTTISLVIPCVPKHLAQLRVLVESMRDMTRLPDELIIAISETTRGRASELLKEFEDVPVELVISPVEHKALAGENRNRGARLSKCDLVSFMDADDRMHPQRLEIILAVYGKLRSRCIVHTYTMRENGETLPGAADSVEVYAGDIFHQKRRVEVEPHLDKWPFRHSIHHGHVTVEKSLFNHLEQNGKMKRGQDADFLMRILTKWRGEKRCMSGIDMPLSMYRPRFSTRDPEPLNVKYVLTACNDKAEYLSCVPMFIKCWKKMYPNILVRVILIMSNIPKFLLPFKEDLILFPPVKGVPTAFTAQYIRLLYPALLPGQGGRQNGGVVLTDIDLLPTNKTYFDDENVRALNTSSFVNLRGDSKVKPDQIAIAYSLATPAVWQEITGIHSKRDIRDRLIGVNKKVKYEKDKRGRGWQRDQKDLFKMISKWEGRKERYVEFTSSDTGFRRLDLTELGGDKHSLRSGILPVEVASKLRRGVYSDYHMLHPIGMYRQLDIEISSSLS